MKKDNTVFLAVDTSPRFLNNFFKVKNNVRWLYLGKNSIRMLQFDSSLNESFSRIDISKILHATAYELRSEFIQWLDVINKENGTELEWWFTTVSSKNSYSSILFEYFCYLEVLYRLWHKDDLQPDLIITESAGLLKTIQKWLDKEKIAYRFISPFATKLSSIRHYLVFFSLWCKSALVLFSRFIAAMSSRGYAENRITEKKSYIIDTFVFPYSFAEDGSFRDRHYPFLYDYLKNNGIKILVHPVLDGFNLNYFSVFKKMRSCDTAFIISEDYLSPEDYYYSLKFPYYCLKKKIISHQFRYFDVKTVVQEDITNRAVFSSIQACLIYRLFLKLKNSINPEVLINWYENQVIDKALIAGVKHSFPDTRIIGAQLFISSPFDLHLFPSHSEYDAGFAPHVLFEPSSHQSKEIAAFCNKIPCETAASLRFSHLYKDREPRHPHPGKDKKRVLLLLPYDSNISIELLSVIEEIAPILGKAVEYMIKPHPSCSISKIKDEWKNHQWPDIFIINSSPLSEAMKDVDVVISSTSNAMVEAAVMGIPVIFIARQASLSNNLLEEIELPIVAPCYNKDEVCKALSKFFNLTENEIVDYRALGLKLRSILFTPIDNQTLSPFLLSSTRQVSAEKERKE